MMLATIIMMRTTVNLPDDVYEMARALSVLERISLGDAIAELVRSAQRASGRLDSPPTLGSGGFPTFDRRPGAAPITLEQTLRAVHEDEP